MTNGEKIKEIFPDTKIITQYDNPFGDRFMVFTLNNEDIEVSLDWWNAEYREPTTENETKYCDRNIYLRNEYNNVGCEDCEVTKSQEPTTQERQAESDKFDAAFQDGYNNGYAQARFDYEQDSTTKNCESCRCYDSHHEVCNYCYKCSLWTDGEPTTKNNLRVDFKELKRKILMEVDGGTDDTWLRCVDVRVRISNSIDEYIADMRGDEV